LSRLIRWFVALGGVAVKKVVGTEVTLVGPEVNFVGSVILESGVPKVVVKSAGVPVSSDVVRKLRVHDVHGHVFPGVVVRRVEFVVDGVVTREVDVVVDDGKGEEVSEDDDVSGVYEG